MKPMGRPLRVLFIDHTAKLGGGEIAIRCLIQALDRTRVEPVVLLYEHGPLADQLSGMAEVHIIPLERSAATVRRESLGIGSLLKAGQIASLVSCAWATARLITKLKVDLVHTNSLKSDVIGGVAARLMGRKVIWHLRDRIASDYLPSSVVFAFSALSRVLPTYVVAVSEAALRTLRPTWHPSNASRQRAQVVHDGLEPKLLATAVDSLMTKPLTRVVGIVGRICPWKGQHIFVEAAAKIHDAFPDVTFEIIGSALFGEDDYEQSLRDLSNRLGLTHALTFTGFVEDVPARIERLEIVVHASITGEPFGLVTIEAMAACKPLVATRGGGIPEIVIDGETGLLVPMGDADAMANAVCRLLESPAMAAEMGRRGRARVEQHFTIAHTANKMQAIYQALS